MNTCYAGPFFIYLMCVLLLLLLFSMSRQRTDAGTVVVEVIRSRCTLKWRHCRHVTEREQQPLRSRRPKQDEHRNFWGCLWRDFFFFLFGPAVKELSIVRAKVCRKPEHNISVLPTFNWRLLHNIQLLIDEVHDSMFWEQSEGPWAVQNLKADCSQRFGDNCSHSDYWDLTEDGCRAWITRSPEKSPSGRHTSEAEDVTWGGQRLHFDVDQTDMRKTFWAFAPWFRM